MLWMQHSVEMMIAANSAIKSVHLLLLAPPITERVIATRKDDPGAILNYYLSAHPLLRGRLRPGTLHLFADGSFYFQPTHY